MPHSVLPVHLDSIRSRITELDSEIAVLNLKDSDALSNAELERNDLRQHLANYIYPVLTVPNELISEIFLRTFDPSPLDPAPPLVGPASHIYLGHICQKWRDIALSTPPLWSTMLVKMPYLTVPHGHLRILELWLARSRDCPLSIILVDQTWGQVAAFPLINALLQHRERWESLGLYLSWDTLPEIQGDLPLLRNLVVRVLDSRSGHVPSGPSRAFLGPNLTTVTLHGVHATMLGLPWAQLTTISINHGPTLHRVVQILRTTPNVTTLSLQIPPLQDSDNLDVIPSIAPLVHLRNLTILGFATSRCRSETELLSRLTLPVLHYLSLPLPFIPEVVDLLRRSRCPLDGLRIKMGAQDYFPVIQADGSIITLENPDEVQRGKRLR
ncbi:hypothetical protein B0H16DRAFT_1713119 [Mycena metata]|uniref:F-box domain-containing protein n=1 Tax=Mycena metata TaxID=1033252 RepID=A0AAD7K4F7_9AGAR|nr:hypothetical protein B0H16DRAFT_1713119 [Mycena metata]